MDNTEPNATATGTYITTYFLHSIIIISIDDIN